MSTTEHFKIQWKDPLLNDGTVNGKQSTEQEDEVVFVRASPPADQDKQEINPSSIENIERLHGASSLDPVSLEEDVSIERTPSRDQTPLRERTPSREQTPLRESTLSTGQTSFRERTLSRENTPIREQAPLRKNTPIRERTFSRENTPIRERTLSRENTPIREQAPLRENTPIRERTFSRENTPIREQAPLRENTPVREQVSLRENTSVREQAPLRENTPIREQVPLREKTPTREKTPLRENTPIREQAHLRENRPVREKTPLTPQASSNNSASTEESNSTQEDDVVFVCTIEPPPKEKSVEAPSSAENTETNQAGSVESTKGTPAEKSPENATGTEQAIISVRQNTAPEEDVVFVSSTGLIQPGVVRIKEERPDEAEIQELAARMVEANKAKMAAQAVAATAPANRPLPNQGMLNYVTRTNSRATPISPAPATTPDKTEKAPMDQASQKGKFGWVMMGEEHLPYIQRGDDKYCAVRMVEMKLLVKYLSYLNSDIYTCTCIRSYFITECEARLLSEINLKHCEARFGREPFTTKDLVVRMEDASEFYNFLELCYNKLMNPHSTTNSRCGFVRINSDSVVPYTVKDEERYVPLFYFEGETETLKKRSTSLGAWDLAYLKFCCKVQGIRSELFANDSCQVISLADIKAYFPAGTKFDEYWPPKVVDTQLLVTKPGGRGSGGAGTTASWIKVPHVSSPPASTVESRIPPTNQITNGWSPMISTATRYQAASLPVTTQPRVSSNQMAYNVTSSNNVNRSYVSTRTNNVNQYYPAVTHNTVHNSLPALGSAQSQAVAPPPLVRVTSANPSLTNSSYSRSPAAVTYSTSSTVPHSSSPMILNNGLMPPPHMQYAACHNNNNNNSAQKYPPPLIPVNGSTSRYYGSSGDVIDLSSPPHSPQRSLIMNGKQTPQPAHQPSQRHQKQQQPQQQGDNSVNWNKLIPITESPARQSNHYPFKMQKALVNGKMVPCINAKPYVYSELLMTVNDLLDYFFPGVSLAKCQEVLQNVLQVTLYSGNLAQKSVLKDNNKCKYLTEVLPLIQLKDVMQYMPQLKYIMERHMSSNNSAPQPSSGGDPAHKRARIS